MSQPLVTLGEPTARVLGEGAPYVSNPFGRALSRGIDLNALLAGDPVEGGSKLDALVAETQQEIAEAGPAFIYCLYGACPAHCTPIQYGGYYLERDREILGAVGSTRSVALVLGRDPYIEFVSDLPSTYLAWDVSHGPSVDEIRPYRTEGLLQQDQLVATPQDFERLDTPQSTHVSV